MPKQTRLPVPAKPSSLLHTSTASTNATVVSAGPATLYAYFITNHSASVRWFKFYNKATAPVAGTDVPVMVVQCPAVGQAAIGVTQGFHFPVGLSFTIGTSNADADGTTIAASELKAFISYIAD